MANQPLAVLLEMDPIVFGNPTQAIQTLETLKTVDAKFRNSAMK
jgi:hypothetical protein